MRQKLLALVFLLLQPAPGIAGDLVVDVRTPQGGPVADAVVTIDAPHAGPIRFPWPYRMAQHDIRFDPFVLVVPVGADVAFPNLDNIRHQVYSFSPTKTFELKLYGHDETRVVHFDKPGVVPLRCNIHDSMLAFILVVDTPYAAKTGEDGVAVIREAPAGPQGVTVWRPFLHAPGNRVSQTVQIPRDGNVRMNLAVEIREPPRRHAMY